MGDNASLSDFLDGESNERAEAADDEPPDTEQSDTEAAETAAADETEPDPAAGTEDVEPAATTYAWDDAGTACDDCGETVERRWQQEGGLVCIECKDWERT